MNKEICSTAVLKLDVYMRAKWCKNQEEYCNHNQHLLPHAPLSRPTVHSTEFQQAMSNSKKSGFNDYKSDRFEGFERESHSSGQKFDQQSHKINVVNKSHKARESPLPALE